MAAHELFFGFLCFFFFFLLSSWPVPTQVFLYSQISPWPQSLNLPSLGGHLVYLLHILLSSSSVPIHRREWGGGDLHFDLCK